MECPTCERRTTLGKAYAIKMWYYWEHMEELLKNLIGSYWGQQKNLPSTLSPKPKEQKKEKKRGHVECMLSLLIGNMKIKVPKIVCQHFLPQLMG
jgi:hypothetical protein